MRSGCISEDDRACRMTSSDLSFSSCIGRSLTVHWLPSYMPAPPSRHWKGQTNSSHALLVKEISNILPNCLQDGPDISQPSDVKA